MTGSAASLSASVASAASSVIAGALACVSTVRVDAVAPAEALAASGAIGVLTVGVIQEPAAVERSVEAGAKNEAERRVVMAEAADEDAVVALVVVYRDRAATTVVGGEREAVGVIAAVGDTPVELLPAVSIAYIVNVYDVPAVKPVTVYALSSAVVTDPVLVVSKVQSILR